MLKSALVAKWSTLLQLVQIIFLFLLSRSCILSFGLCAHYFFLDLHGFKLWDANSKKCFHSATLESMLQTSDLKIQIISILNFSFDVIVFLFQCSNRINYVFLLIFAMKLILGELVSCRAESLIIKLPKIRLA